MISFEEIRKKSLSYYNKILFHSILRIDSFPWEIPTGKVEPAELIRNPSLLEEIKEGSKERKEFGFRLVSVQRETRKFGMQTLPVKIVFDSEDDFLAFLNKRDEFKDFRSECERILAKIPQLKDWLSKNPLTVVEQTGKWEDLLSVCEYFLKNPKPNLYIRELPIRVSTKFIEENKAVLRSLLDFLIPEHIDREGRDFESRYGLKKAEASVRLRILDAEISEKYCGGLTDISIPVSDFLNLRLGECKRVFILENKTNFANIYNFLSFPKLSNAIAIFGQGFGLGVLKDCVWLKGMEILYWGDLDVQGFEILSVLRSQYPQTKSFLMDKEVFLKFRNFAVDGAHSKFLKLQNLTEAESETWNFLRTLDSKNRLEQERIPHDYVKKRLSTF
ncbi:PF09983 family protein [Leptospira fainei serovar Hurstbridge str. BUT 6]|uniref:PF09983 family protein n=1 Tax=Leptospira fainei serovar Hurstbridge str. BUT 6 TaxID=1193011 RepID=S3V2V1_9LEPT|nr:Wadjet anti-phage system protein JetD domain-containing protein [Leptospira fainei]EPG74959.1 PF09983 family protein [Leptospira fainei serovar Hurstbridge str. BUT 6]